MLLGESDVMKTIHTTIHQLSNNKLPVLISGETGVGKGLVAQAIHFGGPRASKPYVPINCGAVPSTLWESAFFGHVRGAFTGATKDHKGYFESANGGTLLLDEVGEMPVETQIKLLHALDDDVITPVGATVSRKVDVRVIAATNADLQARVDVGMFRRDLYYRLADLTIWIPPLRERTEDIPLIAEYHLSECATQLGVPTPPLTPEAVAALEGYTFPGNVRELISIIKYAVMIGKGEAIQPKHLRFRSPDADALTPSVIGIDEPSPLNALDSVPHLDTETDTSEAPFLPLNEALTRYERQYLSQVLEWTSGNKAEAARLLNIPRRTLYRKLAKYNL